MEKFISNISGTAIGSKFTPSFACLFIDKVETDLVENESGKFEFFS